MALRLPSMIEKNHDLIENYKEKYKSFVTNIIFGTGEKSGVVGSFANENLETLTNKKLVELFPKIIETINDGWYKVFVKDNSVSESSTGLKPNEPTFDIADNLTSKLDEDYLFYMKSSISIEVVFSEELTNLLKTSDEVVKYFNKVEKLLNENKNIKEAHLTYKNLLIILPPYSEISTSSNGEENLLSADVLEKQPIYKCDCDCCTEKEEG